MHTAVLLISLLVHLRVRQFGALGWKRRHKVTYSNRGVGDRGVDGGLIGVVPVSTRDTIALVDVYFVSVLCELAVGDEASVMLSNTARCKVEVKPTHPTPVPITATRLMGHLNL